MQHFLVAVSVEAEYRFQAVGSSEPCSALDISRRIDRHAAERAGAVWSIAKSVEDRLLLRCAQLEYGSAALAIAAAAPIPRGALKISGRIPHESRVRGRAIGATGKTVEDGFPAGAIHFEYRSMAMLPAKCGCAIQDAVCIQNYSRRGVRSIRRTAKTVQARFPCHCHRT